MEAERTHRLEVFGGMAAGLDERIGNSASVGCDALQEGMLEFT